MHVYSTAQLAVDVGHNLFQACMCLNIDITARELGNVGDFVATAVLHQHGTCFVNRAAVDYLLAVVPAVGHLCSYNVDFAGRQHAYE